MNWERVQSMCSKRATKLKAERVYPQQYGASNGFGIVADWGRGKEKRSVMASRLLPDAMSDTELDSAISAAIEKLV